MRFTFLAAALAAAAAPVSETDAQARADDDQIDEILVTAAPLGDVLQPTDRLEGSELLKKRAPTLGETLANQPGVSSSYFGPASARPIIRGLGGSRVTMLSGTVSTLDAADVSADHAVTIEPLLADEIEIIRGPTTLLYGTTAAGGVVNVVDNRTPTALPGAALTGGIEVRGDTAAEERAIVGRLDGGVGRVAWHIDAHGRETQDVDIAGFATADPQERPPNEVEGTLASSFSESQGYAAGASLILEDGFLGLSLSRLENEYGLPGPAEDEEPAAAQESLAQGVGPYLDMEQTRIDVRSEFRFEDSVLESMKFSYGNNDYEHAEIEPSGEVGTVFENDAWQARLEAVHTPISGWQGAFGIQVDDRDLAAVGEEAFLTPTVTESAGLFLVEERDFEWGHVHLGARIEPLEHDNVLFPGYDETAFSMAVGIDVHVTSEHELVVHISRAERHPAAEELYADGAHLATGQFEIGLAAGGLRPEKEVSLNVDVELNKSVGPLRWRISGYHNDIDEFVYQQLPGLTVDGLAVARYAQSDATFYGVEAELTVPLFGTPEQGLALRLFGDFVRAGLDGGGELPRIPPMRFGAGLDYAGDGLRLALNALYHAEQKDLSSFETGSFTMVDISVGRDFFWQRTEWELFARLSNLLDEEARRSASFIAAYAPLPGRSLHAGFRVRF